MSKLKQSQAVFIKIFMLVSSLSEHNQYLHETKMDGNVSNIQSYILS